LNNVVAGMLSVFKEKPFAGTVGARLHFEDNTIQHCGILSLIDKNGTFQLSHAGIFSYYGITNYLNEVVGNTAALIMIRKKTFEKIGGFNENYRECFEDVELNFECLRLGLLNYMDGRLVANHYESQTRSKSESKLKKQSEDYINYLLPYVKKNLNYIKKYLIQM
jgi:GT2 family glycosyltransferase